MRRLADARVWLFAFAYFVCYVPYAALAKALSTGAFGVRATGLSLVPLSTMASALGMIVSFTALGWWKIPQQVRLAGVSLPRPRVATLVSGVATGAIVVTTTLAYTFEGVSIPFVMLLMRGGVLVLAPIVDRLAGRRPKWFAWVALALSVAALFDALLEARDVRLPIACAADVALYLVGYFVRLRAMGRLGKTSDPKQGIRYFVEEQMVATPVATLGLAALAVALPGSSGAELREGFLAMWRSPVAPWVILMGLFSQGTGMFGGLVLLDARDHSFCVPLNRASSVLAGLVAASLLAAMSVAPAPGLGEVMGAGLLLLAVLTLSLGDRKRPAPLPSTSVIEHGRP